MKILQIIPADRWVAVFTDDSGLEESVPVVCWALVQLEGVTGEEVIGLVLEGTMVSDPAQWKNFLRYDRHK